MDMSQFLEVFRDEAAEQLAQLEQSVLALERGPDPEVIQALFRAAHTLKGSSRAMGFAAIADLTHAMEDVLDQVRHGERKATGALVNLLFEAVDELKRMVEQAAASGSTDRAADALAARIRQASAEEGGRDAAPMPPRAQAKGSWQLPEAVRMALRQASEDGRAPVVLSVTLAEDCALKSVRALMVLQALAPVGEVVATDPAQEALENEEFGNEFRLLILVQDDGAEACSRVRAISEVAQARVEAFRPQEDPGSEFQLPPGPAREDRPADPRQGERRVGEGLGPEARGRTADELAALRASRGPVPRQTVRVDAARLDSLLNLVGELLIDQTRLSQLAGQLRAQGAEASLVEGLSTTACHVGRIVSEMQAEVMKARMQPIDSVFSRLPRMVRDLAQKLGREVEFQVSGGETELDRSVIELIGDPLIHLLRNCVDHGLEGPEEREAAGKPRQGRIWLRARHQESHILIEVGDDGRGIDAGAVKNSALRKGLITEEAAARLADHEAVQLIFLSGASTAATVTDVSGRGVGMDIVKDCLSRVGGLVEVESTPGSGTRFTLRLPLTLAIIRALLVRVASSVYAIPLASIVEIMRPSPGSVHRVDHGEVLVHREATLPLIRLRALLHQDDADDGREQARAGCAVVVGVAEKRAALVVEGLLGEQEIVIKPLGRLVGRLPGISGATILGDGRIALIVDAGGLMDEAATARRQIRRSPEALVTA